MRDEFRHTKIVCTLGPATDPPATLKRLLKAGLDVARINAAHGSPAEHARRIRRLRAAARSAGRPVAVLLDLPGPKLRLGEVAGGARELRRGTEVVLAELGRADAGDLSVDLDGFSRHVGRDTSICLSDGSVHLQVRGKRAGRVQCRVLVGGTVRSGSGVNLPESGLDLALPTEDDLRWLRFAREHEIDWVGVSFVRSAEDLRRVRRRGGAGLLLLAKIEKRQALDRLVAIVAEADGVMVARGDLGVETSLAEVPLVQKRIIAEANRQGRPVITATQMLESMIEDPTPTRAEVTDVANAVLDGTDAVMLSGETAIGRHPVAAADTLREVILATEAQYPYGSGLGREEGGAKPSLEEAISEQAVRLSFDLDASALVVPAPTLSGATLVASLRPRAPVLALADSERTRRQLALVWGVTPLRGRSAPSGSPGLTRWRRRHRLSGGRPIVVLSSSLAVGRLDTLRVLEPSARRGR